MHDYSVTYNECHIGFNPLRMMHHAEQFITCLFWKCAYTLFYNTVTHVTTKNISVKYSRSFKNEERLSHKWFHINFNAMLVLRHAHVRILCNRHVAKKTFRIYMRIYMSQPSTDFFLLSVHQHLFYSSKHLQWKAHITNHFRHLL